MRAGPLTVICILLTASAALAAEPMAPNDIQATFFNGQPFTASTPGGTKFKMALRPAPNCEQRRRHQRSNAFAVLRLMTSSIFVPRC
jgi:hypothetical protein